jgi:hypothetical protein
LRGYGMDELAHDFPSCVHPGISKVHPYECVREVLELNESL